MCVHASSRWKSSPKCPSQSTLSVLILLSNLCLLAHTRKKRRIFRFNFSGWNRLVLDSLIAQKFLKHQRIFSTSQFIYTKKITTWKREKYHKKPQPTEPRRQENETKPGRMCLVSSTEIFYKHYAMNLLKILSFREKIKKKEKQHEGGGKSSKQKNPCRTMNGCFAGGWWEKKNGSAKSSLAWQTISHCCM